MWIIPLHGIEESAVDTAMADESLQQKQMEDEGDGTAEIRLQQQQQHESSATPGGLVPRRHPSSRGHLPADLVEFVLRRATLRTAARLQLVSTGWRAAARLAVASRPQVPWLFFRGSSRRQSSDRDDYYVVDVAGAVESKAAEVKLLPGFVPGSDPLANLPGVFSSSYRGSHGGWLILQHRWTHRFSLLNPLSKAHIHLPYLQLKSSYRQWHIRLHTPGCTVVFIEDEVIHLWALGEQAWTSVVMPNDIWRTHMEAAVLSGRKLYAVDCEGSTWALDILSLWVTKLHTPPYVVPLQCYSWWGNPAATLALGESRGEILLVQRTWPEVDVFRLDVSSSTWVKLESIGKDRSLFVGCRGVLLGADVPACRGDRIYFIDSAFLHVFNMGNETWRVLDLPSSCGRMSGGTWIVPELLSMDDHVLDILKSSTT